MKISLKSLYKPAKSRTKKNITEVQTTSKEPQKGFAWSLYPAINSNTEDKRNRNSPRVCPQDEPFSTKTLIS